ncbi:DNA-directed RNA polymerase III subunit RPC7 [Latimeria chalumnae]|uniref:RNA polymerase III subunit G n=1 Tax=Latimeria chalumnae TaxID=7897 RepID=H3AD50_LATCH|nr:PREDICTED: DNA-directed RNA polymerase III subunit RPC7 [Latimeria chalumnae]|eukprot:XP_006005115.1 PREDICTED: DNA-directed RNA polymerase III subunit RPC7 [Latimeria chalumnae]
MSGKGRGRGRASFTFNIEAIGFSKGEALPESTFQPRPLFPPTDFKPVPLKTGDDEDYMMALKQELRGSLRKLPFCIAAQRENKGIERYADKYQKEKDKEIDMSWTPDWRRLPRELKPSSKKLKRKVKVKAKTKPAAEKPNVDVIQKLEDLEKKDAEAKSDEEPEAKEKGKKEGEEEEAEAEEEYDEEELEEENDYIDAYFDNGEGFGGESDDNMDEATY